MTKFQHYVFLMRLDKPIGIWLLLWPTLWGLWIATQGLPSYQLLTVFIGGTFLIRSAGCIMNDLADTSFDKHVKRTRLRPLASGMVRRSEAIALMLILAGAALLLVWQCNWLTIKLAFIGAFLAVLYPFLKRITYLPQVGLGVAFSWGVPMAFAAQTNHLTPSMWVLFFTCLIWPVIYDTMYAMVDREDDVKIGVKSTAILFGYQDKRWIGLLQFIFIVMLANIGWLFDLQLSYYISIFLISLLFFVSTMVD